MTAVVIDHGSGSMKAGFSGEEKPKCVFSSIVGRKKYPHALGPGMGMKDSFVGDEAQFNRGIYNLEYPITNGIVTNWEKMQMIWNYMFYHELNIRPEEQPVLLTEAPLNSERNRETLVKELFEYLGVPGIYISIPGVLSLHSLGMTTGCAVDIGDGLSHVVPVYEGGKINHAFQRQNLAGRDLTMHLKKLMEAETCMEFKTDAEFEIAREIKERMCYTAIDFDQEISKTSGVEADYELPDGSKIRLGSSRFRCPEVLFKPELLEMEAGLGIHELIYKAIQECDSSVRKDLMSGLVLSGGSSMFAGFEDRLLKEVKGLCGSEMGVKITAEKDRNLSAWLGGSMLSSLSTFQDMLLSKREYEERGSCIVRSFSSCRIN